MIDAITASGTEFADPRIPTTPPLVAPVPTGAVRPTWSVMIPTYNRDEYLEEALRSVLHQDPGPDAMQIAVVDDASTTVDTKTLVEKIGGARVEFYKQAKNVGSVRNFNTCLSLARGQYVHLLHADDHVLNGYYSTIERLFTEFPQAGACFSGVRYINEEGSPREPEPSYASSDGVLDNWLQTIATAPRILYAAISIKRSVYEGVGGYFGVSYGEDWEMHVRIASRYPVAYTPKVLAEYRAHKQSISREKVNSGQNLSDMAWVVNTIKGYLPQEQQDHLHEKAKRTCALFGLHYARHLWRLERNRTAAARQLRGALQLYCDEDICRNALSIYEEMSKQAPP